MNVQKVSFGKISQQLLKQVQTQLQHLLLKKSMLQLVYFTSSVVTIKTTLIRCHSLLKWTEQRSLKIIKSLLKEVLITA